MIDNGNPRSNCPKIYDDRVLARTDELLAVFGRWEQNGGRFIVEPTS